MPTAHLDDRGIIKVSGEDAEAFLQGIITCDMKRLAPARFGALLTPQGKILFDFIILREKDHFLLDATAATVADFVKRLSFYKLRAKVTIEDVSARHGVLAGWDIPPAPQAFPDPRAASLGWRAILPIDEAKAGATTTSDAYHTRRIACGVPESGRDFIAAETFPHEADMDQLDGVDFDKGCFIGQEVVARMQHRGTARTRAVPIIFTESTVPSDSAVTAGGKPAGHLGSTAAGRGIAVLRLDRVADALAEGSPLLAGGIAIRLEKPDWARFAFPGEDA
ncbi:folate-binding protein [Agaricicola taiwanensis]|uniref:Folate-binding protein n=1 Tax=Agaricicola taiwanensis TaxID=591372 RepID=A0A8J2VLA1_9RHOB|nr:folate-binding protein YgfZ [Agaricicola taiwanensis]GGE35674.1 folate-binding protein [Agaricicola taiwanensis]